MPYLNLDADIAQNASLQKILWLKVRETLDVLTKNMLLKSLLSMQSLLYCISCNMVSFARHAAIVGNYYEPARAFAMAALVLLAPDALLPGTIKRKRN